MKHPDPVTRRDQEHPDPQELNQPIPTVVLVLVAILLGWAIHYIATQAPGTESSSTPRLREAPVAASPARAG